MWQGNGQNFSSRTIRRWSHHWISGRRGRLFVHYKTPSVFKIFYQQRGFKAHPKETETVIRMYSLMKYLCNWKGTDRNGSAIYIKDQICSTRRPLLFSFLMGDITWYVWYAHHSLWNYTREIRSSRNSFFIPKLELAKNWRIWALLLAFG